MFSKDQWFAEYEFAVNEFEDNLDMILFSQRLEDLGFDYPEIMREVDKWAPSSGSGSNG